jgi:hypothetical protein
VLNYKHYVCRLWCTEGVDVLLDHDSKTTLSCNLFYDLLWNVRSLGLEIHSFHLLLNALVFKGSSSSPLLPSPSQSSSVNSCSRFTFAGPFFRWGILRSTMQGIRFLAGITHLTLWITDSAIPLPTHPRIPSWVDAIPFDHLESLEQLEVLLVPDLSQEELDQVGYYGEYYSPHPLEVLVLTHSSIRDKDGGTRGKGKNQPENRAGHAMSITTKSSATVIEAWLRSADPLAHGLVSPLYGVPRTAATSRNVSSSWESHFLEGQSGRIANHTRDRIVEDSRAG